MFDIKWIRENPEAYDAALANRGAEPAAVALIALDTERREAQTRAQEIQSERNKLAKKIGAAKSRGEDASEIIAE
ncbi:MAG: serine--tRNA ligase, partial [Rhodospirillales bacterium]|nr:serine--tRNA ligase [Rhodospirillales bacterium]